MLLVNRGKHSPIIAHVILGLRRDYTRRFAALRPRARYFGARGFVDIPVPVAVIVTYALFFSFSFFHQVQEPAPSVCQKCLPLANSVQGRANWHQLRP